MWGWGGIPWYTMVWYHVGGRMVVLKQVCDVNPGLVCQQKSPPGPGEGCAGVCPDMPGLGDDGCPAP